MSDTEETPAVSDSARLSGNLRFKNVFRFPHDSAARKIDFYLAITPLLSILPPKMTHTLIGVTKINDVLGRTKRSIACRAIVRALISLIKLVYIGDSAIFPMKFELWRNLILRAGLLSGRDLASWRNLCEFPEASAAKSPGELALPPPNLILIRLLQPIPMRRRCLHRFGTPQWSLILLVGPT